MWEKTRNKIGKAAIAIVALTMLTTAFAGCLEGDNVETVKVNGSSTVFPIADRCAEIFNDEHDDIQVQVGAPPVGSGGGIDMLGQGQLHIGCASREIKQSERDEYPDVDFTDNPVAADGVAIVVSKDIYDAGVTGLTSAQVKQIYDRTINNWQAVGGPDKGIAVYEREEGSGTRDTFMEAIYGDDDMTTNATAAYTSNAEVQSAVGESDNGIGYVGLGYVDPTSTPAIDLDGVEPTEDTIKDGSYPINRQLHMYTDGTPTGAVKTFIDFVKSSEGQAIVEDEGFIPL
ncbi:MAG: phosphate ABC transporter substrate-binding protein [Thermoplasmatota archaeon]